MGSCKLPENEIKTTEYIISVLSEMFHDWLVDLVEGI